MMRKFIRLVERLFHWDEFGTWEPGERQMTPFAEKLVETIGKRLAKQMDHSFGDYHRYYAEEIVQEIAPLINAEISRLFNERNPPKPSL